VTKQFQQNAPMTDKWIEFPQHYYTAFA